ncbi:LPS assembly lipoprotein LptE [Aeoliella mucimassa]|uniref:Lipopolysaccharide-assembly n=1 Tax=Aeoliella mucimassa TaxID=2527972 RepID=A0A518AVK6_9BACT|nr:LPS assembly lipoprotein LptE [Aeoliella mucimassa]QDU58767.1 hypothetical protein Pan181_50070 [Aeoliella mucimassa]
MNYRHLLLLVVGLIAASGCANYRMGNESLYAPDIQTIYVPMIESDSYRRDLGERLTEAVINEVQLKTPYRVVSDPSADAVLSIKLNSDIRRTLVEDAFDATRLAENRLQAEVVYVNRRRAGFAMQAPMATPTYIDMPAELGQVGDTSLMVPAVGQTVASSQQIAIERLAQQIVGSIEEEW